MFVLCLDSHAVAMLDFQGKLTYTLFGPILHCVTFLGNNENRQINQVIMQMCEYLLLVSLKGLLMGPSIS